MPVTKRNQISAKASVPPIPPIPSSTTSSAPGTPAKTSTQAAPKQALSSLASAQDILHNLYTNYIQTTPQRTKLLDAFQAYLLALGALQFIYCVVAGNYPFNAFLAGFGATVGQFVLTASLRIQTNPANAGEFKSVSPERAFADFVLGSVILHFFCVNFIN